jgi:hypothetical protein
MKPYVTNAADASQVNSASGKERRGRDKDLEDLRAILALESGRRFIWRYLGECGVFRSSWEPSAKIHFNEGRRDIGLRLLDDVMNANPQSYITMMAEAKREEEKRV